MHTLSSSVTLAVMLPTSINAINGSCFLKRNCTRGLYALNFEQKRSETNAFYPENVASYNNFSVHDYKYN